MEICPAGQVFEVVFTYTHFLGVQCLREFNSEAMTATAGRNREKGYPRVVYEHGETPRESMTIGHLV